MRKTCASEPAALKPGIAPGRPGRRMRLSLSLQRSQALAIYQRAGRALAQANGFRGGGLAPEYSMSDRHVLTRGY
eukprot:SM000050S17079  [mRNA]  locus=s50:709726:710316:+ [translate_table: standard]